VAKSFILLKLDKILLNLLNSCIKRLLGDGFYMAAIKQLFSQEMRSPHLLWLILLICHQRFYSTFLTLFFIFSHKNAFCNVFYSCGQRFFYIYGCCPGFFSGSFVWKVLSGVVLSVPFLSECIRYNRKLNITFNFRFHMYEIKKKVWHHMLLEPSVTNCHTFSDPSPLRVSYFMDGP